MALMRGGSGSWRDFADIARRLRGNCEVLPEGRVSVDWSPAVDVLETEVHYIVRAELPGATRDEVEVSVSSGRLVIWGERPWPGETDETTYRRVERSYGWFLRQFTLPADADHTQIEALFRDGILEIAIPKLDRTRDAIELDHL